METRIKYLDFGNGIIIKDDEFIIQSDDDNVLDMDDAFADTMSMCEKIDNYYKEHENQ